MRIEKINIKNKFINLKNMEFNFDKNGVYLIKGENGVGKTSLIKNIIFEENSAYFSSECQSDQYKNDRKNLFSYISQDINVYECSILSYIKKGNKNIYKKDIEELISKFDLSYINLNQSFKELSGGEKIKVHIISGILKKTPYIFMDEPTNNLDDFSVKKLNEIIQFYSKEHTFIIVSHDPRLEFNNACIINIDKNGIKAISDFKNDSDLSINENINNNIKLSLKKIITNLINNKINYFVAIVILCLITFLAYMTNMNLEMNYSNDYIPEANIINVYKVDLAYGELNERYVEAAGLKVEDSNKNNMISYEDISMIDEWNFIKKIIMFDDEYFNDIYIKLIDNTILDELNIIAVPQDIIENEYYFQFNDICNSLEIGRLPEDNKREIVLSYNQLKKYYKYDEDKLSDVLGNKIIYNNIEYTIVGINSIDVGIVSYEKYINKGFYEYDSNNYNDFKERSIKFKKEEDYGYINYVSEILIYTEEGKEKEVLDKLISTFPSENYISNEYVQKWMDDYNQDIIVKEFLINMLFAVLISVIVFSMSKMQLDININKIKDYQKYYIDKRKIKISYILGLVMMYLVICIFEMIIINFLSFKNILAKIIIFDFGIIFVPIIIYILWKIKND